MPAPRDERLADGALVLAEDLPVGGVELLHELEGPAAGHHVAAEQVGPDPLAELRLAARLEQPVAESTAPPQPTPRQKKAADATARGADAIGDFLTSSSGRALTREVVRGVFGMLKRSL